jgi:hypothetical protein
MRHLRFHTERDLHSRAFLLERVQPALGGLMDSFAPIFGVVLATRERHTAFVTGLATALGAGVPRRDRRGDRRRRRRARVAAVHVLRDELRALVRLGRRRRRVSSAPSAGLGIAAG